MCQKKKGEEYPCQFQHNALPYWTNLSWRKISLATLNKRNLQRISKVQRLEQFGRPYLPEDSLTRELLKHLQQQQDLPVTPRHSWLMAQENEARFRVYRMP